MTSKENPFFAKSMANRTWSYFFGRGIIDPVDDIRGSNPASNPELLDALAASGDPDFAAERYLAETVVADASELDPVIDAILAANPGQVEAYRGGKEGLLGFFVGQVMKETQGKADARVVNERLREKLSV